MKRGKEAAHSREPRARERLLQNQEILQGQTKVTLLGTGGSAGVPLLGCECPVCTSTHPRNVRSRVSVYVEAEQGALLIDTSPDLRQQALQYDLRRVDAVLYTHDHADHTHGIDEMRCFNHLNDKVIPVYGDADTLASLKQRFDYVFRPPIPEYGWFRAALEAHEVNAGQPFTAANMEMTPFPQIHGRMPTLGFRIGDFAYSTDVSQLPEEAFAALEGVKVWVVDCLRIDPAPTHAHLDLTLEWIARVKPERAILTHMNHTLDYVWLSENLPDGVEPGYDGMAICC